jgi:hypothetical protein
MPGREWTVAERADWELRDMRADLQEKIEQLPPASPRALLLRAELDSVVGELESRAPIRGSSRRAAPDQ